MSRESFPVEVDEYRLHEALRLHIEATVLTTQSNATPYIVHMLGIPGSGKSTVARLLYDKISRSSPIYVGFDALMARIPEYDRIEDRALAFSRFEIPAREAGYVLLRKLLEKRANILFDHGGASVQHPAILKYAKNALGYRVFMVQVLVDRQFVEDRLTAREAAEGRHTPRNYLDDRQAMIDNLKADYQSIGDGFFQIRNDPGVDSNLRDAELVNIAMIVQNQQGARP